MIKMKQTKIIARTVLVGFIFSLIGSANVNAQIYDAAALKFSISLDKNRSLENEAIILTLLLENADSRKIYAPSLNPLDNQLSIYVVSIVGDTLEGSYISGNAPGWKYPTLDSSEKDVNFINLLGPIYSIGILSEEAVFERSIPVGEYTVQAKLWHRLQGHDENIFSNKLNLKVEEPKREEKKVYDLLCSGYKKFKAHKQKESIDDFLKIARKFPHSAYIDAAYHMLSYYYWFHMKTLAGYQGEDYNSIANRFIQNYPNSGLVAEFIEGLRPGPGKPVERKKFYEDIIKKYPNTKASMYAENQLDKWRRGKIWVDEPIE